MQDSSKATMLLPSAIGMHSFARTAHQVKQLLAFDQHVLGIPEVSKRKKKMPLILVICARLASFQINPGTRVPPFLSFWLVYYPFVPVSSSSITSWPVCGWNTFTIFWLSLFGLCSPLVDLCRSYRLVHLHAIVLGKLSLVVEILCQCW